MTTLKELVQALPAELYDEIYNFIFTADDGNKIYINKSYKPPATLQVSRVTRKFFAESYYFHSIFIIPRDLREEGASWLESLTASHRAMFNGIRIVEKSGKRIHKDEGDIWFDIERLLKRKHDGLQYRYDYFIAPAVLKFAVTYEKQGKHGWVSYPGARARGVSEVYELV